jgi:tetratricopeptide (TPR) repeat protein
MGTGRFADAVVDQNRWLDAARKLGDPSLEGLALVERALSEILVHDMDRAESTLEEAVALADREGVERVRTWASLELAHLYISSDRHAEAARLLRYVDEHAADLLGEPFTLALWSWWRSRWDLWAGRIDLAIRRAVDGRRAIENQVWHRVAGRWNEAHARATRGEYELALGLLREVLATAERVGEVIFRVRALNTVGYVYGEIGDLTEAMSWNQKGLEATIAAHAPVPEVEMNARLNLAENLMAERRFAEAAEQLRVVEAVVRHPTPVQNWMRWRYAQRFLHGFGEWWLAQGDPTRALALAEECLAWAQRSESRKNIVKARRLRGQAYLAQGRLSDAEQELEAAAELAHAVASPPQIWMTYAALAEVRRAQRRPDDAREAYRAAFGVVEQVARALTDEALRATFLASDDVGRITAGAETPA